MIRTTTVVSLLLFGLQLPAVQAEAPPRRDLTPMAQEQLSQLENTSSYETFRGARKWLKLGKGRDLTPGEEKIVKKAREMIMSEPNWALKVYENVQLQQAEMLAALEANRARGVNPMEGGVNIIVHNYLNESARAIEALGYLPSEDSVEVLAKFLADDRTGKHGTVRNAFDGLFPRSSPPSNARLAATSLKTLEVGPIPGAEGLYPKTVASPGDVDIYRTWWAEVEAGRRDYYFGWEAWGQKKILPREQWPPDPYALEEPRQASKPAAPAPNSLANPSSKPRWPLALAALAVLAALGFLLRGRMSA